MKPAETGNMMTENRPDFSWLFSTKALRWKSWFYQGLIPKLAIQSGPILAGQKLEKISSLMNRSWLPRRLEISKAIRLASSYGEVKWDSSATEGGLARQLLRYLARDCLFLGIKPEDWQTLFHVSGLEFLDQANQSGKGYILLGSHLGGHVPGVHWLIQHGYDFRMLVQRPRHVSDRLNQWFDQDHSICSQRDLFLKRNMAPTDAVKRMTDARRLIQKGVAIYLNCDIPWTGPNTNVGQLLGQPVRFQSIWIDLAMILNCPVIQTSCRQLTGGRFDIKFSEPLQISAGMSRDDIFVQAINRLESEILEYPDDAVAHILWPHFRPARGQNE
jgi:lauroyl/myristoyl acyltransferase